MKCPSNPGVSWASPLPSFWEILQAALPLAPDLKGTAGHWEGNLTARQWLWMGTAAWSPCFSLASPLPGALLLLQAHSHVFGLQSPRSISIFPFACGGHLHMQGWRGVHALQSFCYLSFAGDSLLSSLCDSPPCLDTIRLSKSFQKLSVHACCPWGYPLQVPGAEEQDAENP